MRILFAGTPDIAVPSLQELSEEHDVVGVLTNPDRTKGRGKRIQYSPVKEKALELGLPVFQPLKLSADFSEEIKQTGAEILICIAYGKIFSSSFLSVFPRGGINLHPSRLPDLRGPSPLNAIILRGDKETAVTVQTLARKMDSGDILLQEPLLLDERESTESLTSRVAQLGGGYLLKVLDSLEKGSLKPVPQDHSKATFCTLIGKDDGRIGWSRSARDIDRLIRAYTPWPHGFTFFKGLRLNILEAHPFQGDGPQTGESAPGTVAGLDKKEGILIQTGEGLLAVTRLQLQSKNALDYKSFLNGTKNFVGSVLGEEI